MVPQGVWNVQLGNGPPVRRLPLVIALALIACLCVWFGHAPPRTSGAYRTQAQRAATLLASQARTADLWVSAIRSRRVTDPAAVVGLEEAEEDAEATASRFAAYDPPPGTEALRRDFVVLSDSLRSALADVRISARTGSWDRIGATAEPLAGLAIRLDAFAEGMQQ